jgi:hypothetical protein
VPKTARNAERLAVMILQRTSGMSLDAIGQEHGISRQRVRHILALSDPDYDGHQIFQMKHAAYIEQIRHQARQNPLAPKSSLGKHAAVEEAIGQAEALRRLRLRTGRAPTPPRWLVFYRCFAGRVDRLEASARVTRVAVTREFVGLL